MSLNDIPSTQSTYWNKEFNVHTGASLYAIGCMSVHQGLIGGHVGADANARNHYLAGLSKVPMLF